MAASLPWTFGAVIPRLPSGSIRGWDLRIRPLLPNIRLFTSIQEAQQNDSWDWFLAHNVNDLMDAREISLPKVFLVHGTLSGRILQDKSSIDRASYVQKLEILLTANNARVAYISDLKKKDWGIPGTVVRSAVNTSEYGGYRGDIRGILQVCNHLRERGAILGWDAHRTVCKDLSCLVLGANKNLSSSRTTEGWEDLKEQLRCYRLYLFTAAYPYEDGYNLALLEAMATGMPIASLEHPTSPIRNGVEGVVASTPEDLRRRVLDLLDAPDEAVRMGKNARKRVEELFPLAGFQRAWQSLAVELLQK